MTARQVLEEMCAKYLSLTSYSDEGTVVRHGKSPAQIVFRTYFQRPCFFRFDYTHTFQDRFNRTGSYHEVLFCDGARSFLCEDGKQPTVFQHHLLGIGAATGVSMGAAHTISAMLMKDVNGFLLTDLERVSLTERPSSGTGLYRVKGFHRAGDLCQVSIGVRDLLLQEVAFTDEDGITTVETHSDIRVDEPIQKDIFQYARPDKP
jgi:hypothetical protein